jgi:hypothetical protein
LADRDKMNWQYQRQGELPVPNGPNPAEVAQRLKICAPRAVRGSPDPVSQAKRFNTCEKARSPDLPHIDCNSESGLADFDRLVPIINR